MNQSKQTYPYQFIRILSYLFLSCGLIIIILEVLSFFQTPDYSFVETSNQHFMAIMMLLWYGGLRYLNKKNGSEKK